MMRPFRLRRPHLLILHLLCQAPLFFWGALALGRGIGGELAGGTLAQPLFTWAAMPPEPKIESVLGYVLLVIVFAAAGGAVLALWRWHGDAIEIGGGRALGLALYELVAILAAWSQGGGGLLLLMFFYALALPVWIFAATRRDGGCGGAMPSFVLSGLLVTGSLLLLFQTVWAPDMRLLSEYLELPSYTRLAGGKLVENTEFLWRHGLQGSPRFDVCDPRFQGIIVRAACLALPRAVFKDPREAFLLFPPTKGLIYRWDRQELVAYSKVTPKQRALIEALWGRKDVDPRLQTFALMSQKIIPYLYFPSGLAKGFHDANADNFLSKAGREIILQQNLGFFFYHEAYLYIPVREEMAEVPHVAPSQYGEGLTRVVAVLVHHLGKPWFNSYLRVVWAFFLFYLLLAAVPGFLLGGGRFGALAAVGAGTLVVVLVQGILPMALRIAPGFNPMRHLPDLLCFTAIYLDCRFRRGWSAGLRAAFIALFIWWNRDFGLFMLGASLAWHGVAVLLDAGRRRSALVQLLIEAAVGVLVLISLRASLDNGLVYYELAGLGTPLIHWRYIVIALIGLVLPIGWELYYRFGGGAVEDEALAARREAGGIGLLYCALGTTYVVWNPTLPDLSVILLAAVVPALGAIGGIRGPRRQVVMVLSLAMVTFTLIAFGTYRKHQRAFSSLVAFDWNFPGLKARVTADPKPLTEALGLIDRYQPSGPLILISRYDAALYIASNRTPALPYIDLKSALVSWPLLDSIEQAIRHRNTPYIFVDRDIFADRGAEMLWPAGADRPWSVSAQRVGALSTLGLLARELLPCYRPVAAAGVLEAWQNTCQGPRS